MKEERIPREEAPSSWNEMIYGRLCSGALCHLERTEPLIPLCRPTGEALMAGLAPGEPVPLLSQDGRADGREETVAVAGVTEKVLEDLLERLRLESVGLSRRFGCPGLCLAEGLLTGPGGISGPLLLWPVRLERREDCWQLLRGGEGQLLNRAVLSHLEQTAPAPEEGWSQNREPLNRQVDQALETAEQWTRADGLWLGCFPVWALELAEQLDRPLPGATPGSTVAQLRPFPPQLPLNPREIQGEEGILAPLPLDGVQMTALRQLLQGDSVLVSGHRGTGKTQLVAGLMANAMGSRQRVLLAAWSETDRRTAWERMKALGLERLCLYLPGEGDRKRTVLHQFNVAAQLRAETTAEDYFSLSASTAQLAQRLDRHAAVLHTPGKCGLSPFQLICRYMERGEERDYLPLPDRMVQHLDAEGLERRLICARELVRAAQTLGQPAGHPLSIVQGCEYDPEKAAQLSQATEALAEAAGQLERAGQVWQERTGQESPVTREDWVRFQAGARLLLEWRDYPPAWAASHRIPLLGDAVRELKRRTEQVDQLEAELRERWEDGVFAMDAVSLEKQWRFLKAEWTLPSEPDRETALRKLLLQAEALLNALEETGRQWAKCVSVPVPNTRDQWERYYEVAVELARWKEIPSEWGGCASLQALLWDVGELVEVGKRAKESKEVLLRDWSEEFLSLDGQELLARWSRENGTWGLGWLKRQGGLRGELEPYCKGRLTTDTLENGIRWLADYQEELGQCDEIYHRWPKELRSVYKREETIWLWLEAARKVAAESHDWLTELTGSEDFLRQYGSSPAAVAAAGQLQEQWERAREVLGRLDVIIGRTGQPDSRDWLLARRNDCRRLRNLLNIRRQLEEQAKEPVVLGQIAGALGRLAQYQKAAAALDALYERWRPELEGLYNGGETDWDTLYTQSLQAVKSDDLIGELTGDLELRARLAEDGDALAEAERLFNAFQAARTAEAQLERLVTARMARDQGGWLSQLRESCQVLMGHLDQLEAWMNWRAQCRRGESLGLRSFVAHYETPVEPGEDTLALFERSLYRALLQLELDWLPELKQFSARQMGEILRRYAQSEEALSRRTREELFHVAADRIPDLFREEDLQEELGLLRWANQTGAKDISLDGLLRGLPQLTARLFPCVIASPADALRCFYLPETEGELFDYVAIEGAERTPWPIGQQLLGLGGAGLLLSGGRRMDCPVCGAEESIWSRCRELKAPVLELARCYLPRQESLQWLDKTRFGVAGLPTPCPGAFRIQYKTVVGRMNGGTNPAEAAAVANQAVQLVRQGAEGLAIVAMTGAQSELIRRLLRQAGQEDAGLDLPLERVIVTSAGEAESGCGARVLLSLTLGPDDGERLRTAEDLVSGWDGCRPLSDAVAAAREELWVFSSLDRPDWSALGAVCPGLEDFLRYAQAGVPPVVETMPFRDRVRWELCQALKEAGWRAEPGPEPVSVQAGAADQPGQWLLGILLDGQDYSELPRTRERELTQAELLQAQGWSLCRVWTMDWWQNRKRVTDQLCKLLERLQAPGEEAVEPVSPSKARERPLYTPAQLTVMGIRDNEVSNPAFRSRIYRVVEEILRQEAPISVSQLTERMLKAFGLDDQDPELRDHCASLWRKLGLRITREERESYVWPLDQDPDRYRGFRRCGTGKRFRRPEDVSCQEGANAACAVLQERVALTAAELVRETARELGYCPDDPAALDCGRRGTDCALFMGRAVETAIGCIVLNPKTK